jgi:hypothetical protein
VEFKIIAILLGFLVVVVTIGLGNIINKLELLEFCLSKISTVVELERARNRQ